MTTSRTRSRHRYTRTAVAILTAAVVTGCSTTAVEDPAAAAAETATASDQAAVLIPAAPGERDPGDFDTTPSDYPDTAGTPDIGSIIESQRMAEFLVLPAEVDPALTQEQLDYTRPIFGPIALAYLLADTDATIEQIGEDTGMYAGFSTARFTPDRQARMIHSVLQFRDAAAAAEATVRLHEHLMDPDPTMPSSAVAHPLDSMPESLIHAVVDGDSRRLMALTPHGHYVIYTFIAAPLGRESWAEQALAHTLELQKPMIDAFPYTEPAGLADLPVDIDGLLHRTLPFRDDDEGSSIPAVYGPRGAAHLLAQLDTLDVFEDTFATHMARDASFVYATDFTDRAESLFDRIVAQMRNKNDGLTLTSAAGPPGVPDARCFEVIAEYDVFATCALLYDTYVAEIRTTTLGSAHRATTAQYLIFEESAA